jgi:hypothetical protein
MSRTWVKKSAFLSGATGLTLKGKNLICGPKFLYVWFSTVDGGGGALTLYYSGGDWCGSCLKRQENLTGLEFGELGA